MARRRWRSGGDCGFAVDPSEPASQSAIFWLPHLDPAVVVLTPAPSTFSNARNIKTLTPSRERVAADGAYSFVEGATRRLPIVLVTRATVATPLAALIPLDANFAARTASAARMWRLMSRAPPLHQPDRLTRDRRQRLTLALRALDGWLANATYRELAQALFGARRIPADSAWKTHELRDRTIRLVRTGVDLMRGGYLALLRMITRRRR